MNIEIHGFEESIAKKAVLFFCEQLEISPNQLCILNDSTIKSTGICYENEPGDYLIVVSAISRNITEIFLTIAHELVHVKQFMKNNLAKCFAEDAGKTPYKERWWEQEAYEKETELLISFVKTL